MNAPAMVAALYVEAGFPTTASETMAVASRPLLQP